MENYEEVYRLTDVAADSTGTATEKMNVYLDSVEAKTNQLKATWEEFVLKMQSSDAWKQVLDFLIGIAENLEEVISYLPAILTFIAAINMKKIIGLLGSFINLLKDIPIYLSASTTVLQKYNIALTVRQKKTIENILAQEKLTLAQKKENIQIALESTGLTKNTAKKVANKIATDGLTASTIALSTALSLIGIGLAAGLALWNQHNQSIKEARENQLELYNETKKTLETDEEKKRQLESLKEEYKEICLKYGDAEEKQQALKELSEKYQDTLGNEISQIGLLSSSYDTVLEKMDSYIEKQDAIIQKDKERKVNEARGILSTPSSGDDDLTADVSDLKVSDEFYKKLDELGGYKYGSGFASGQKGIKAYWNNIQLNENTNAGEMFSFEETLEKYLEENEKKLTEDEKAVIYRLIGLIEKYYTNQKDAYETVLNDNFEKQFLNKTSTTDSTRTNNQIINDLKDTYKKIETVQEKYRKSTEMFDKSRYKKELNDLTTSYQKDYDTLFNGIVGTTDLSVDTIKNKLSDLVVSAETVGDAFENIANDGNIIWEDLGKNTDVVNSLLKDVQEEITETGDLSVYSRQKIQELFDLLQKDGDFPMLKKFIQILESIGIEFPDSVKEKIDKAEKEYNANKLISGSEDGVTQADKIRKQQFAAEKETKQYNNRIQKLNKEINELEKRKLSDDILDKESMTYLGMASGAAVGSAYTPIGTLIGAISGAIGGNYLGKKIQEDSRKAEEQIKKKKQELESLTNSDTELNKLRDMVDQSISDTEISLKYHPEILQDEEYIRLKQQLKDDDITTGDSAKEYYDFIEEKLEESNKLQQEQLDLQAKDLLVDPTKKRDYIGDSRIVGNVSQFTSYLDDIDDMQGMVSKLEKDKVLNYKDLERVYEVFPELQKEGELTAEKIQKAIDATHDRLISDLDTSKKKITEFADDIEKIINNVDTSGLFNNMEDGVKDTISKQADEIEDAYSGTGDIKFQNVSIDPKNIEESTKALEKSKDTIKSLEDVDYDTINNGLATINNNHNKSTEELYANAMAYDENANSQNIWEESISSIPQITDDTSQQLDLLAGAYWELAVANGQSTGTYQEFRDKLDGMDFSEAKGKLEGLGYSFDGLKGKVLATLSAIAAMMAVASGSISPTAEKTVATEKVITVRTYNEINNRYNAGGSKNIGSGSSGSSGSGSSYTAEDAAKDLKDILNDIEEYERDIEADLEDQTEELLNHYHLRRNQLDTLREELDYYDDIYDVTENTTKWLETQMKILDEESEKVGEIQNANEKILAQRQKLYDENSRYNPASWFDSELNETLAYGDLLNSFEYRKKALQEEADRQMRDIYNSVSGSTDKDTISDAKERIKLIKDDYANRIEDLDKERDKVENIHDSIETLNDAWKDNQEAIRDALKEMNDRVKAIRDELVNDIITQLERAVDKMNKSIEKDVTRLEQLKQVQESYNDILNTTIETQQELDDELRTNMDTYQYLDEQMRQLIFNEDDYKQLSGVLEGIQEDIANIWENHYNQIQNLTEDEMYKAEYITNETERQLAMKQKEYDLAKAELDVAKAQTNLNNVKNERNTRMFVNGQWIWTSNPEDVKNAQQQLNDAEREKTRIEREREQQQLINQLDKFIDSDNLQIDKNNDLLEKIQEAIEQETEEVKSVEEALLNADKANLPALNDLLQNALGSDGGYMTTLLKDINHSTLELAAALRGQTVAQAIESLKSGTLSESEFKELANRLGYSFDETTGVITTQDGSFAAHYKGWSQKSNADVQLTTGENGVSVTGNNTSPAPQSNPAPAPEQSVDLEQIAREVWLGKWGNGQERKRRLTEAGYNYTEVQRLVNKGYNYFFDKGGVAVGIGQLAKDTILPERVLSPQQTKAFENLVQNLTTNPVLSALSKIPSIASKLGDNAGSVDSSKKYYFSNFTVQANDLGQFIDSIETMLPMAK